MAKNIDAYFIKFVRAFLLELMKYTTIKINTDINVIFDWIKSMLQPNAINNTIELNNTFFLFTISIKEKHILTENKNHTMQNV